MSKRVKGFSHERDLVRRLWEYGFAVMRAPASGSKAKRVRYPDIVAIYRGKVIVIEAKTMKEDRPLYISGEQVDKLLEFANRSGGEAYIAVKKIGTGEWFFIPVEKLEKTQQGNYKLSVDHVHEGIRLEALISVVKSARKLTDYMQREH
ncbi:MAG: Holliday junction resolvase Hjc [Desulfurococcaceae archaeon]